MTVIQLLAACLRKELVLHLTDSAHFITMLIMPLFVLVLLTYAVQGAYAPAIGTTAIPAAGDRGVIMGTLGANVNIDSVDDDEVRDRVRDGRSFYGLIADGQTITVVGDEAFPAAVESLVDRLRQTGQQQITIQNADGEPLDLSRQLAPFNYTLPGVTVMFLFNLATFTGSTFYGDVVYGAWLRIKASKVSPLVIFSSKVIASVFVGLLQIITMFSIGWLAFGLELTASDIPGILAIGASVSLVATTFGIVLTGLTRTFQQLNQISNLFLLVFAGLGGAAVPIVGLPKAIQRISLLTPHYWALRGFRDIMFRDFGYSTILANLWPLLLMAAIFCLVGLATVRYTRLSRMIY